MTTSSIFAGIYISTMRSAKRFITMNILKNKDGLACSCASRGVRLGLYLSKNTFADKWFFKMEKFSGFLLTNICFCYMIEIRERSSKNCEQTCTIGMDFALSILGFIFRRKVFWIWRSTGVVPCGTFFRPNADAWQCRSRQGPVGGREEEEMNFEEENRKCKASCPICGRGLCRAAPNSVVEIYCPKCKSPLLVSFENGGFSAKIIENTGDHKFDPGAVCWRDKLNLNSVKRNLANW